MNDVLDLINQMRHGPVPIQRAFDLTLMLLHEDDRATGENRQAWNAAHELFTPLLLWVSGHELRRDWRRFPEPYAELVVMREFLENGGAEEGVWTSLNGIMQESEAASGYVAFAAAAYVNRRTQAQTFAACLIIRRMCDRAIDEIEAERMGHRPPELA